MGIENVLNSYEVFKLLQNIVQYIITQIILEQLLQITLHTFPGLKHTSKLEE